jgi:lipopolysaccharide exporter
MPGSDRTAGTRRKTSFSGDVAKLVTGTTFAQLISVLASPILTHYYGPSAFGLLALFGSIISVGGAIACLRYESAVMLPETDSEAANLFGVCFFFSILVAALTIPLIWFGGPFLRVLKAQELSPYTWMIPVAIFFAGAFIGLNTWNSRTRHFGRLSIARVTSSVVTTGTQLGSGFVGHATGGALIGASVIGSGVSTAVLGGQIWRDDHRLFLGSIRWREMARGIVHHRRFPLYGTWAILLNTISWQVPTFLLSAYFSAAVVGFYALGTRVLRLPMNLIGNAIGLVFFERAATARRAGRLAEIVEATFRRLVRLGLFPLLLLTFVGRDLFVVVFGAKWAEAGVYTQILSVWMFFWFVSGPMRSLVSVLEKQRWGLIFNVVILVTRFGSIWVGARVGDVRLALLLFGISGVLVYGGMNQALMAASGVSWSKSGRILLRAFVEFLPAAAVLLTLYLFRVPSLARVAAATVMFAVYLIYCFRTDVELRGLLNRVRRKAPFLRPVLGREVQ